MIVTKRREFVSDNKFITMQMIANCKGLGRKEGKNVESRLFSARSKAAESSSHSTGRNFEV
jgi:hypothetical protein